MTTITPLRPPREEDLDPPEDSGGGRSLVKLVTAVVPPDRFETLCEALNELGAPGMTVSQVGGVGRQRGHAATYRGAEYTLSFVPKLRVQVLIAGADAERLVDVLAKAVRTGRIGDGKIWVLPVESVRRIRTGEVGVDAL